MAIRKNIYLLGFILFGLQSVAFSLENITFIQDSIYGKPNYFRVGKSTAGRWWFLTPDNKPFYVKGVTSVNRGGLKEGLTGPYDSVVNSKFGPDSAVYRDTVFARMRSWNFNSLGGWSTQEFWDKGMPYTKVMNFAKVGKIIKTSYCWLPDVYDSVWIKAIDSCAQTFCIDHAQSKDLIGYFSDNELNWASHITPEMSVDSSLITIKKTPSLLQTLLSFDTLSSYNVAWDHLLGLYGTVDSIAKRWRVSAIQQKSSVNSLTNQGIAIVSHGYIYDDSVFTYKFASQYFEQCAKAIYKYDTNHLMLGCRFSGPPSYAVFDAIKRPWIHVVSANNYRDIMYDRMEIYYKLTGLPVLNTEFSWASKTFWSKSIPNAPNASTLDKMLYNGEVTLRSALRHPALVGWTWYRWVDTPPGTGVPFTVGLVTIVDTINTYHVNVITSVNKDAEEIAYKNISPNVPLPGSYVRNGLHNLNKLKTSSEGFFDLRGRKVELSKNRANQNLSVLIMKTNSRASPVVNNTY